jgi:hypothetical protein
VLSLLAGLNVPAAVCLATSAAAAVAVVYFLLVDALAGVDFDPRPVVWRALDSGRFDRLLIAVADARYRPHATTRRLRLSRLAALKGASR